MSNPEVPTEWDAFAALEAENAALKEKADAFDWLERVGIGFDAVADPDNNVQVWYDTQKARVAYGKTLMEAVTNARKEKP